MNIINPTISQVVDLLGKWVICRVDWGDGEEAHDTEPAQIVGVVMPAPDSRVAAQILMHKGSGDTPPEGYQFELFLSTVKTLRVVSKSGGFFADGATQEPAAKSHAS